MQDEGPKTNFWIGNAILAAAMLYLLFMGAIWQHLGGLTMVLWIGLVIAGVYFLLKDRDKSPNMPG